LAQEACKPFELDAFREGHLTPVFFGSALRNFGVRRSHRCHGGLRAPRRGPGGRQRQVEAGEARMTGFVFKIQANMDPNHRDRIAFMRVCSGKLTRGMKAKLVRTGKPIPLTRRNSSSPRTGHRGRGPGPGRGGLPNHGTLRIGDTLHEGEDILFPRVPSFAPKSCAASSSATP
jgi:peptide chain release factor 3